MKFSFESPQVLLESSRTYNDYDYFLDVFDDKETKEFFIESLKLGRTVYLDNSLFERVQHNLEFNENNFLNLALELNNYGNLYVVVPDFINSAEANIEKNLEWSKKYPNLKFIMSVHGNSLDSYKKCFYELNKLDKKHLIAFSMIDDFMKDFRRSDIIKSLEVKDRKIHIFGLRNPRELYELREIKQLIYSLDTSLPITSTLENKGIEYFIEIDKKPKTNMYEVFYKQVGYPLTNFVNNVNKLKSIL